MALTIAHSEDTEFATEGIVELSCKKVFPPSVDLNMPLPNIPPVPLPVF